MPSSVPRPAAFPAALADVAARVETRIGELLDRELERWTAIDGDLRDPIEALRALVLAGGKRLRPAFCACGFAAAGGDPDDGALVDAAAALELVHTFALVHDDVMDGSDSRRGLASVHRRFVDTHDARRWRGESRRFGEGIAILVGDFAFVYADVLMRGAPPEAIGVYDELRVELCVGQSLDLFGTARRSTDHDTARRIATYKSGKYTVERPLHLGAALAAGLGRLAGPLTEIGLPLGEAFQLRDDVLGVFGDPSVTGKPVGDDLREGKPTPLVALASARVDAEQGRLLDRLGAPDLAEAEVAALQVLFVETGVVADVEERIAQLVGSARERIAAAPITDDARRLLDELARYVAWREC